ncbi:hypothetical protein BH10CYA1_BH10CYA1_45210 [soil metagenome]
MSQTVRNDSLNNFATNRDQDLGKAIAEAASALSSKIPKPGRETNTPVGENLRSEKTTGTTQEKG